MGSSEQNKSKKLRQARPSSVVARESRVECGRESGRERARKEMVGWALTCALMSVSCLFVNYFSLTLASVWGTDDRKSNTTTTTTHRLTTPARTSGRTGERMVRITNSKASNDKRYHLTIHPWQQGQKQQIVQRMNERKQVQNRLNRTKPPREGDRNCHLVLHQPKYVWVREQSRDWHRLSLLLLLLQQHVVVITLWCEKAGNVYPLVYSYSSILMF